MLVTSWSLAGLAIALVPFTEPTWHVGQWYGLVDTADAIVFGAVAYALLARGRHPVSWLVALCAVGGGLAALSLQWSMLVIAHPGPAGAARSSRPRSRGPGFPARTR